MRLTDDEPFAYVFFLSLSRSTITRQNPSALALPHTAIHMLSRRCVLSSLHQSQSAGAVASLFSSPASTSICCYRHLTNTTPTSPSPSQFNPSLQRFFRDLKQITVDINSPPPQQQHTASQAVPSPAATTIATQTVLLADRSAPCFLNLRGMVYDDPVMVAALSKAGKSMRYVCPVWSPLSGYERAGLALRPAPVRGGGARPEASRRHVKVTLSSGATVELINIEETTFFAEYSAKQKSETTATWSGNEWAAGVLGALRTRGIADGGAATEAAQREWASVPRNVLGTPLGSRIVSALQSQPRANLQPPCPTFEELQAMSPVWVEAEQAASLGLTVKASESGHGFVVEAARSDSHHGAPVFRAPQLWYHEQQLEPHPTVTFSPTRSRKCTCLSADGVPYNVATTFRMRDYCTRWGYNSSLAVFCTPSRLRQRAGCLIASQPSVVRYLPTTLAAAARRVELEAGEEPHEMPPPFSMILDGEVITLWNTQQTSVHEDLFKFALTKWKDGSRQRRLAREALALEETSRLLSPLPSPPQSSGQ